jgi:alcohol dehydrogenase YqhD (iron-dependent ADH family)
VRQVDAFQYLVQNYFSRHGNDMAMQGSVVDAVFSVLLANGNQPMTDQRDRRARAAAGELLMKTFGGSQIYHGIRPLFDEE